VKRNFYVLLSLVVLASIMLAAYGGGAATEAPAIATEAPVAFVGEKLEATDCNYGGNFKSIEAVDQYTVKFTYCAPDPAFLTKIASVEAFDIYDADNL